MVNYDSSTKEGKCIFCEIINGNIQTPGIFWQNKDFMAFLSLYPSVEGFTVLVPKKHFDSDVLKMPNEDIQLLPEDTFAAFTKGSDVLSKLTGVNNNNNTNNTPSSTNSKVDLTHTLNINITAPSNVNTDQVIAMFNDTGVSQALGVAVKEAFNNGGLTTSNPNKHQLMNSGNLQYS
jgi:hypothetical protein